MGKRRQSKEKRPYDEAVERAKLGDFNKTEPSILVDCCGNIKRIRTDELLKKQV